MSGAFERAWALTAAAEGGYANHPDDPGGETNHGITFRVARANGYTGAMRDLPSALAVKIAKTEYWDRLRLDEIAALSEGLAAELFDTNFNLWFGAAGKFLQRALNALNRQGRDYSDLAVDGNVGAVTVAALVAFLKVRGVSGEVVLLRLLNAQQCCDYLRQATEDVRKESFLYGWVLQRVVI
jgi:lysozyme family protein